MNAEAWMTGIRPSDTVMRNESAELSTDEWSVAFLPSSMEEMAMIPRSATMVKRVTEVIIRANVP